MRKTPQPATLKPFISLIILPVFTACSPSGAVQVLLFIKSSSMTLFHFETHLSVTSHVSSCFPWLLFHSYTEFKKKISKVLLNQLLISLYHSRRTIWYYFDAITHYVFCIFKPFLIKGHSKHPVLFLKYAAPLL